MYSLGSKTMKKYIKLYVCCNVIQICTMTIMIEQLVWAWKCCLSCRDSSDKPGSIVWIRPFFIPAIYTEVMTVTSLPLLCCMSLRAQLDKGFTVDIFIQRSTFPILRSDFTILQSKSFYIAIQFCGCRVPNFAANGWLADSNSAAILI